MNSTHNLNASEQRVEERIIELGGELQQKIRASRPGIFDSSFWHGKILERAMQDNEFKIDLFRFVDVLPYLKTGDQLSTHITQYFGKHSQNLGGLMGVALKATTSGIAAGLGSDVIKHGVEELAQRFIVGENPESAMERLRKLYDEGPVFTVDLLGEETLSKKEAVEYQQRYLELIEIFSKSVQKWPAHQLASHNHLGVIPLANISLKITALSPHLDRAAPEESVERLFEMTLPIFRAARKANVFINIDMEQWDYNEITNRLFYKLLMDDELADWPHLGIVLQGYLKNSAEQLEEHLAIARKRGVPFTIRLVKGAYWDYEVVHARQFGFEIPVFTDKALTDLNYEKLTRRLLENSDSLVTAFGSHNRRSLLHAIACAEELKLPNHSYEIQMLYGMAEPERQALLESDKRVRLYAPLGNFLSGIGYFVRRLLENTSNQGFLRLSYHDELSPEELLKRPVVSGKAATPDAKLKTTESERETTSQKPFVNTPFLDFNSPEVRDRFAQSCKTILKSFPREVPIVIKGKEFPDSEPAICVAPAQKHLEICKRSKPTIEHAITALQVATASADFWRDTPLQKRCQLLDKLAELLEESRYELAALIVYEVGKNWHEADGDLQEAIDFCRYYSWLAPHELGVRKQGSIAGEDNQLHYEGRGVTTVIAPWNFPTSILTGMTVAALVAGNPVIMKPSSNSATSAYEIFKLIQRAGFPPDVVQFIPGGGETVGNYLVEHPDVTQIAFTGSKEVGLSIVEKAARTKVGQRHIKRVVAELGGKNAIIVDDDGDLDQALGGIIKSAFGYAGQKCSACSRVIVVGGITYETLKRRLVEGCRSILLGPPHIPGTQLGPVIDERAYERLKNIIKNPASGAKKIYDGNDEKSDSWGAMAESGYYLAPVIFEVENPTHIFMQEEFFGPILTLMKVDSFEEALGVALNSEFGLTGGVYTRSPDHVELARQKFRVGNLYINRHITAAMVDRQPFGGFNLSGLGTKAGGPNYLLQFANPRLVTENTMRRGFTPEIQL